MTAIVFPLHQRLQHAVKDKQKQISISNQHIRVPRWCAFKFAQVLFQCVLGMRNNSVVKANSKKHVCKKYWYSKKKTVYHLDLNLRPPECKSVALPIELYGCGFQWNVARAFSTSSSSSGCRTQVDHCIDSWWQTWRRTMMDFWC